MSRPEAARASRPALAVVVAVFALLFGWQLFQAVSNLVALPALYTALGFGAVTPWWVLILGVLVPPGLFAAALLLGRGRALFDRTLMLAVGLAAASAVALSLVHVAAALQPPLG